jgi:amidase
VIEWDISSHAAAYEMWLKAILADGGKRIRDMCAQSDEPLVEGMLVGTEADGLSIEKAEEVSSMSSTPHRH